MLVIELNEGSLPLKKVEGFLLESGRVQAPTDGQTKLAFWLIVASLLFGVTKP